MLNLLLPSFCLLCGSGALIKPVGRLMAARSTVWQRLRQLISPLVIPLCVNCYGDLPCLPAAHCRSCANELLFGELQHCGRCLAEQFTDIHCFIPFQYRSPINQLITELKFQHRLVNLAVLGSLLALHLAQLYEMSEHPKPQVILPVPLHPHRLKQRGFNQAIELAYPVADQLQIPLDRLSLLRIVDTRAQSQLNAATRQHNVKQAFAFRPATKGYQHVAILDDVMTTGSTLRAICRLLRAHGVQRIDLWCCAKA